MGPAGEEVVDQGESGDRFGIQGEGRGLLPGVDTSFISEYSTSRQLNSQEGIQWIEERKTHKPLIATLRSTRG